MSKKFVLSQNDLNETVELIKQLVEIPTESPIGKGYVEFIDFMESIVRNKLPKMKIDKITIPKEYYKNFPEFEKIANPNHKRIILILKTLLPGKPKAHLNGHYDVVEAGDFQRWTICPPYEPKVINGRIYGRGACDMKGSMATLIKALEIIYRENRNILYDLDISFTPDEEVGSFSGLRYLIDETKKGNKFIEGNFFFSLDSTQNEICIGKTGIIHFEIEVLGESTHIARSFTGINAINLSVPFLNELIDLKIEVEQRVSKYPCNSDLPIAYVRPNLNITSISGGFSESSVPDRCLIRGNRTVIPDESENPMIDAQNELINLILRVKQSYQIKSNFYVKKGTPASVCPDNLPDLLRFRKIASRDNQTLFPAGCSTSPNDIVWVKKELNIPFFNRGVQREGCNVHGYNENVPIENLKIAIEDLVNFLSN